MLFPTPLLRGTLVQRINRFMAEVQLDDGGAVTAAVPNTGSMLGLKTPGSRVWLSVSDSPTRKYPHTWEMVETDLGKGPVIVGINTNHPNKIVTEAIQAGQVKALQGYASLKREQKYGKNSRIDILLEDPKKATCYVEIKNVHLSRSAGLAEFPDSVTERGVKHLAELSDMVAAGRRAVMVYLIQRADVTKLAFARDIDTTYADAFIAAKAAGVEAIALRCALDEHGIHVETTVPIKVS
jgi:sugar fermentation stimulation protein A